jgi:iron complex transport system substrate-binding protein
MDINQLTSQIIESAAEIHRLLGPGLPGVIYEECLASELAVRGIGFRRHHAVPIAYKGAALGHTVEVDLVVEAAVLVALRAGDRDAADEARLSACLRLTQAPVGLLIDFGVDALPAGIRRLVCDTTPVPPRPRRSAAQGRATGPAYLAGATQPTTDG